MTNDNPQPRSERLPRYLARCGIGSRRECERFIQQGKVRVNGKLVNQVTVPVFPEQDHVKVDGKLVQPLKQFTYLLLNKPRGYIVTRDDPQNRPLASELFRRSVKNAASLHPIGRLDFQSEGLLLFTNDGELSHKLAHPRYKLNKTYLVKFKGTLQDKDFARLRRGIFLGPHKTLPAGIKRIPSRSKHNWVEITLKEGRNRQIRRMGLVIGHPVIKLRRIRFSFLNLEGVPPGKFRHLRRDEIEHLRRLIEPTKSQ